MKNESKNSKGLGITLAIGLILIVIFFTLILFTTVFSNVTKDYNFVDTVVVYSDEDFVEIGNLTIRNEMFLPSKVKFDKFFGCYYDEDNNFDYVMFNTKSKNTEGIVEYSSRYVDFDLKAKSEENFKIFITENFLPNVENSAYQVGSVKRKKLVSAYVYVFNLGTSDITFYSNNICSGMNPDDSVAKFFVEIKN